DFSQAFTLGGNGLALTDGLASTSSPYAPVTMTIGFASLNLGNATITNSAGNLIVNSPLDLGLGNLTVQSDGTTLLAGIISGQGLDSSTNTLTQLGSGILVLGAANSYSGTTTIVHGAIDALVDGALGSSIGGTTVFAELIFGGSLDSWPDINSGPDLS